MADKAIQVKNIYKSYNNIPVLKKVDITFKFNRVYAIVGKNGVGKSTLVKLLSGIHQPDRGEIIYNNTRVHLKSPKDANKLGWSFMHQNLDLFENLTITENVFLNNFPTHRFGIVNRAKTKEIMQHLCKKVGLKADPNTQVKRLGMGEKHLVALMRMMVQNGDLMVLDELFSSLTVKDDKRIQKIIKSEKEKGKCIIFITHNLSRILEFVDTIVILRDGEVVLETDTDEIMGTDLIKLMVGQEFRKRYPKLLMQPGREILRVKDLSVNGVLDKVSFSLKKGEVLGITGLVGSGRTMLSRCLFGAYKKYTGDIFYNRKKVDIKSPKSAVKYGIGWVPDDRNKEGIFGVSSLMLNMVIAHVQAIEKPNVRWMIDRSLEKEVTTQYLEQLGVEYFSLDQQMKYLSSGNQQKVIIGRWFLSNCKVLILDEPTKELDIASKVEVYNLINEITRQGKSVIFISSDFSEIVGLCDRTLVLSCGKIVAEMDRQSVSKDKIMEYALAGETTI